MDIGYSLWEQGLSWFTRAPGGVNRWSIGAFLVMTSGILIIVYRRVSGGFNGSAGQLARFAGGVLCFVLALAGGAGFLLVAGGAFDVPPAGKEALACLACAAAGITGVILTLRRESR